MPMVPYVVRQGDFLTKLAYEMGFDPDAVWNDPKNASLKKSRTSFDVLCPGDVLYVPQSKPTSLPLTAGSTNNFTADVPLVDVTVTLMNDGEPLKNATYHVALDGSDTVIDGSTDGSGLLKLKVPLDCESVVVTLDEPSIQYRIRVGHMNPDNETSGIRQRLANLGYIDETGTSDEVVADAVRQFQKDAGLPVTGTVDDDTRSALVGQHGH
jgi:Putative peptidoglycan binding domain